MDNWNTTFQKLTEKADQGDVTAANTLHTYYAEEKDMLQTFDQEHITFYRIGANERKPYSLYMYAVMHFHGFGVPTDYSIGTELLKLSLEAGCSQAYFLMAELVNHGLDNPCEMDHDTMMKKSMELNNSNAFVSAGTNLKEEGDDDGAIKCFQKAISLGNNYALHELAQVYHDAGTFGKAKQLYERACANSIGCSYFNLGVMYREGEGVPKDMAKTMELFEKARELGDVKAVTSIASIYMDRGEYDVAMPYLKEAVAKDDPLGIYNMGLLYKQNGKHKLAIKMFIKGVEVGNEKCVGVLQRYGVTRLDMTDKEIDDLLKIRKMFSHFGCIDEV